MRIYWQVEEGGVGYKQSYTRREPKNNVLRLLNGKTWYKCDFNEKKVICGTDEVRVIAGPNYNIPSKISEKHVLIINIFGDYAVNDEEKLRKMASVNIETDSLDTKTIISAIIKGLELTESVDDYKILDLIYMTGDIFEGVYKREARAGKMNLSTLLNKIYKIKTTQNASDENANGIDTWIAKEINDGNIKTLYFDS